MVIVDYHFASATREYYGVIYDRFLLAVINKILAQKWFIDESCFALKQICKVRLVRERIIGKKVIPTKTYNLRRITMLCKYISQN